MSYAVAEPVKNLTEAAQKEMDKLNHETDELTADLEAMERAEKNVRGVLRVAQNRLTQIFTDQGEVGSKLDRIEIRRGELERFLKTADTL